MVFGTQFAATGAGYMAATIFNPKTSQIFSVVFSFINAVLAGTQPKRSAPEGGGGGGGKGGKGGKGGRGGRGGKGGYSHIFPI